MPPTFCDDCGQPAVGSYEFFYENKGSDAGARWSAPRNVCLTHKHIRENAGHRSRLPIAGDDTNAPDPAIGTQAPDFDKNPSGRPIAPSS